MREGKVILKAKHKFQTQGLPLETLLIYGFYRNLVGRRGKSEEKGTVSAGSSKLPEELQNRRKKLLHRQTADSKQKRGGGRT